MHAYTFSCLRIGPVPRRTRSGTGRKWETRVVGGGIQVNRGRSVGERREFPGSSEGGGERNVEKKEDGRYERVGERDWLRYRVEFIVKRVLG